jgi:preprotein translocase subunit SecG
MLEQLIVIIHILAAISVVGLILLQQGKGADMGASFGSGASQTVMGVQGGGNFLTHTTAILATVFFISSLSLAYYAKQKSMVNTDDVIIEQTLDQLNSVNDEIPVAENDAALEVPVEATPVIEAATTDTPAVEQKAIQAETAVATPEASAEVPAVPVPAATDEIPE